MLYHAYDMQRAMLAGASSIAGASARFWGNAAGPLAYFGGGPMFASALDVFAHAAAPRGKPRFNLPSTLVDGRETAVIEEVVVEKPFGNLLHFKREGVTGGPRLLIVAPMSGHYATLLRGTVERMLPGHDVYITDWADAKLVPTREGRFDLDDYIDYLIAFLGHIGPDSHVLAVCQPSVPAFAAVALMNAAGHPAAPRTLTMMGGPIDTREAPTQVNMMATQRPHDWFAHNVIARVPHYYGGGGRKVYPGFLQLGGFMSMNLGSHMMSHWDMFRHLVDGDDDSADATKAFYDEYRAVCDMTAEFYLQTVETVFQRHSLPKGEFMHRGARVDPAAITRTALLAIEGERDDISGLGQTRAALTIATGLDDAQKRYHMASGVGHYGIFNGSKWREEIAPVVEAWIAAHE
ncbi:MAG: polyhydroxyalkanoate depolymerase [Pseudomonadota bacterium]|mgnify:CR=1 FL=1